VSSKVVNVVLAIPTLSKFGAERTVRLIEKAHRQLALTDQVFVIDNGGHFMKTTTGEWRDAHHVSVFCPPENIGVGPAWNAALRTHRGSLVILANDDIVLADDSIDRLVDPILKGDALMTGTAGHGFSFFAMHPEQVRRVGFFDEGFAPAYYEDTDYLRRMNLCGAERLIVETGAAHAEQSTSADMGWDARQLIDQQGVRYVSKWGGFEGEETFEHPWGIDFEVCVPSCSPKNLQRLIDSLAWQTVRPPVVTIASNADIDIDTRGMRVRQVKFRSDAYAIGEGDVSLRRNVATWAAQAPYIVYSDDDQVWPQNAMEWFVRLFAKGEHFVVGHHRFVDGLDRLWRDLRTAKPEFGVSRERMPNVDHWWQSCWGGAVGVHAMMIKYGVSGWDMGYPTSEDQQLARRICGQGDDSQIRVHEPPWAWHERNAVHAPPWDEPHRNVCKKDHHEMVADSFTLRCAACPIVRRVDDRTWPVIQTYDPSKVSTEETWL
jgi:hypothetical protein